MRITYLPRLIVLLLLLNINTVNGQFGIGLTAKWDLYQRLHNPTDDKAYPSAGSAILNFGAGPKIWLGKNNFSISTEATAGIGLLSLALKDYKGLGSVDLPILINLNFNGLSGLDTEGKTGFSVGGGIQWSKTEFYGLKDEYVLAGVQREWFQTYLIHLGYGFGLQGFGLQGFGRYGFHPDNDASSLSVGVLWDFNFLRLRKIKNKASEL